MRNKPLPGMMKHSPMKEKTKTKTHSTKSEDPNMKMGYTEEFKKLKRVVFGQKKGTLKKKGLSIFDFDDTI